LDLTASPSKRAINYDDNQQNEPENEIKCNLEPENIISHDQPIAIRNKKTAIKGKQKSKSIDTDTDVTNSMSSPIDSRSDDHEEPSQSRLRRRKLNN